MNTTILKTTKFKKFSFIVPDTPELGEFERFKTFVDDKANEIYGASGEALYYDVNFKWEEVSLEDFREHQDYDCLEIGDST